MRKLPWYYTEEESLDVDAILNEVSHFSPASTGTSATLEQVRIASRGDAARVSHGARVLTTCFDHVPQGKFALNEQGWRDFDALHVALRTFSRSGYEQAMEAYRLHRKRHAAKRAPGPGHAAPPSHEEPAQRRPPFSPLEPPPPALARTLALALSPQLVAVLYDVLRTYNGDRVPSLLLVYTSLELIDYGITAASGETEPRYFELLLQPLSRPGAAPSCLVEHLVQVC